SGRPQRLGCWLDANIGTESDRRTNFRFDLDWYVGRHALRFGATVESIRYSRSEDYSGGVAYEYHLNGERFDSLSPESDLVRVRTRFENGAYKARSRAAYFQDRWLLSSTLTLDLGVRWEGYQQQNSLGETFIDVSRQLAPRVGIVWDIRGDGRSKLYGNAGIYHMPIRTESSLHVGSGAFSQDAWYTLEGDINPDGSPSLFGMQLSHHLYKDGSVPHPDETSSSDLEPMSTREIVVGYEQTVGANWSFGVRGTASRYNQVIEDILIDKALWDVYRIPCFDPAIIDSNMSCTQQHRLTNPGSDFKGWYDVDGDGELDSIFLPADVIGVPQANQTNYAVDLTFQRRFADRWMLQGVYTWSRSYGNYEDMATPGFLRKDTSTNHGFDVAALLEHSHGKLPADRRHTFKVFAMYAFDSGFQVGANYWFRSGRPINGFGMHPTDPWAQLHDNTAFYNDSEPCPRGCGGRTETTSSLDLNFRYNLSRWNAEWSVQLDVYNVINSGTATEVDDSAENISFLPNPSYLMATEFQAPRAVRLGFGVRF
ncbi:MAG: TonB-dependent receptor, partial [bacterium]|nr:TonB-dependent receptor [bacterium]